MGAAASPRPWTRPGSRESPVRVVAPGDSCAHDSGVSDVSITFTSAELAELRQWTRLLAADKADPTLVGMIQRAYKHSQDPQHPPELSETGDVTVWCVVRSDSPDGPAEVQHWAVQRVDPPA
jgi:hypothetical protein